MVYPCNMNKNKYMILSNKYHFALGYNLYAKEKRTSYSKLI